MSDGTWNAVTVNLGGAGPQRGEYAKSAHEWITGALGKYHIMFAQEIHGDDWLKDWRDAKYTVIESPHEQFRARSAILVRSGITAAPYEFATAAYHGSYVAAACVAHPAHGPIVVMSVHASPNRVSEEWAKRWQACHVDLPEEYRGDLWDSDLVLESVRRVATAPLPVIAAGDWNEARLWDDEALGTTSGKAFFARVAEVGLVDRCCAGGEEGGPTHFSNRHRELHLDHVLATPGIAELVDSVSWSGEHRPADHAPVEFTIG